MLAFHEAVVFFTPVSCSQDRLWEPRYHPQCVLPGGRCLPPSGFTPVGGKEPKSQKAAGPSCVRASDGWVAACTPEQWPSRSQGLHTHELVPGPGKVKPSPLLRLQQCSKSKLFMFSSCRAWDLRPPAKKLWLMVISPHCPLSQQERGPQGLSLHKMPEVSTDSHGGHGQTKPYTVKDV